MSEKFLKTPPQGAKEKIIMAAFDLFHEHGIHDASVDDILEKSGTGKSQFYHYFGSKEGLIHAVLEEACRKIKNGEIIGMEPIESWDDLRGWFDAKIDKMMHYDCTRSCPIGRFAGDLSKDDEHIRRSVLLVFEAIKQYPREFFVKAQARGELRADVDPDELADFCESVVQGGSLLSKMEHDIKSFKSSMDHAFVYLESLKV